MTGCTSDFRNFWQAYWCGLSNLPTCCYLLKQLNHSFDIPFRTNYCISLSLSMILTFSSRNAPLLIKSYYLTAVTTSDLLKLLNWIYNQKSNMIFILNNKKKHNVIISVRWHFFLAWCIHLHLTCTLYLSGVAEVAVSMVASRSFFTIATKKLFTICLSQMEEIAPIAPIVA